MSLRVSEPNAYRVVLLLLNSSQQGSVSACHSLCTLTASSYVAGTSAQHIERPLLPSRAFHADASVSGSLLHYSWQRGIFWLSDFLQRVADS